LLQQETTSQIKLIGAKWEQLHGVVPKALFKLQQPVEIVFQQLPSILSLRQRERQKRAGDLGKGDTVVKLSGRPQAQVLPCVRKTKKNTRNEFDESCQQNHLSRSW